MTKQPKLDYEAWLAHCRAFVAVLPIYLRCGSRIQVLVHDLGNVIDSPATTAADRELAYRSLAGALLSFADEEAEESAAGTLLVPLPPGMKALMGQRRQYFGTGLKSLRRYRRWTQAELARCAGVGRSVIAALEKGQGRPPVGTLLKLAVALEVDNSELWPWADEEGHRQPGAANTPVNGPPAKTRRNDQRP